MIYNFDSLSFQVLSVGLYSHADGEFSVEGRPHAAFSSRLKGSGRFLIDGKELEVEQGDIIFVPAGMPYKVEYFASESIVVHMLDCNYAAAEKIAVQDREKMETHFRRVLDTWQTYHSVNCAKGEVYNILSHLESHTDFLSPEDDVLECVRYLEAHYTETDLTVERLCREGHISHSSLQRKFRQYFGMNPKQYIIKLRMNRALDLMTTGGFSIKRIAYCCGFEDEKYFSRVFKQTFGYSPARFHNKMWT